MFSLFGALCLITLLLLSLFLFVLSAPAPRKHLCNQFLFALLFINAALILTALLAHQHWFYVYTYPFLFFFVQSLFFLLPPSLYLYVQAFTSKSQVLNRQHLFHFIPAPVVFIGLAAAYLASDKTQPMAYETALIHFSSLTCVFIIYYAWAWKTLIAHQQKKNRKTGFPKITWMAGTLIIFGIHWSFSTTSGVLSFLSQPAHLIQLSEGLSISSLLVFCCLATYLGVKQLPVLVQPFPPAKYAGSNLAPREIQHLATRITTFIEEQKPFLDPALSSDKLAGFTNLTPRQLSQVLNEGLGKNFFDLINNYRLEEAKELLSDAASADKTILEILYQSGFNSKSAFHRVFKQQMGITPTEFRKQFGSAKGREKNASHFLKQDDE